MEQIFNIAKVPQNVRELFKQTRVGIRTFTDLAQSQEKREKFQKDYGLSSDKILLICDLVRQEAKTNPSLQLKTYQASAGLSHIQNSAFKVQQPGQMMMSGNKRRNLLLGSGQIQLTKIPSSTPQLGATHQLVKPFAIPNEIKIPQQSLSLKNVVSETISQALPLSAATISLKSPPQTERLTMTEFLSETATTLAESRQVSSGPKDRIGSPSQRVTAHFDANALPIPEQSEPLTHFEKVDDTIMIDIPLIMLEKVSSESEHELDLSELYKDGPLSVPISPPLDSAIVVNPHILQNEVPEAESAQPQRNLLAKDDTLSEDDDLSIREEEEVGIITGQEQKMIEAHHDQQLRDLYPQQKFMEPIISSTEQLTLEVLDQGSDTSSESLSSSPSQEEDMILQNESLPSESEEDESMQDEHQSENSQLMIPEQNHASLQVAQSEHIIIVEDIQEHQDPQIPDYTETLQESSSSSEFCPLTDQVPSYPAPPSHPTSALSPLVHPPVSLDESTKPSSPKVVLGSSLLVDVGCQCEPWLSEVVEAPKKKMKNKKFQVTQKKIDQSYEAMEEKCKDEEQVMKEESSEESEREEIKIELSRMSRTVIKTQDVVLQTSNHPKKSDNESQSSQLTFNYFQDLSHPVPGSPCNSQRPDQLRPILKKRLREEVQEQTQLIEDYDEDLNDLSYLTQQPTQRKRVRFDPQVYADLKRREQLHTNQSSTPKSRTMLQRPSLSNDKNQFAPNAFNQQHSKPALKASQKAIQVQKKRFQEDHYSSSSSNEYEEEEKVGERQARGHQAMKEPRNMAYGPQKDVRFREERDIIKRQMVEEDDGTEEEASEEEEEGEEEQQEAVEEDQEEDEEVQDEKMTPEPISEKYLFKQQILTLLNAFKK